MTIEQIKDQCMRADIIDSSLCLDVIAMLEIVTETLDWSLDNTIEHDYGCLFCGGDKEYVSENGESSLEHRKVCQYYLGIDALKKIKGLK